MATFFLTPERVGPFLAAAGVVMAVVLIGCLRSGIEGFGDAATAEAGLVIHDDRLQVSLFAADPDIVTPVGLAIDEHDRLYVLESHTHSPPSDYDGLDEDVVKVLSDTDGDGRADSAYVYAGAIDDGMNWRSGRKVSSSS